MEQVADIVRAETTHDPRGDVFVVVRDGRVIGEIVRRSARIVPGWGYLPEAWFARSAGNGVEVSDSMAYPAQDGAMFSVAGTHDSDPGRDMTEDGLTRRERDMLDFESKMQFTQPGTKAQAIRDLFSMSIVRYYQTLNRLIDTEPALRYAPVAVNRLRRLREEKTARLAG
jgi:hypothetical protein